MTEDGLIGHYDIAIVGGGIAGCAAAISAARAGKRTVLLERSVLLGGLATSGLINWWEPMCDGTGRQLIYGISEEMLLRIVKYSKSTVPPCWKGGTQEEKRAASKLGKAKGRYVSSFSPTVAALALLDWVKEEGVEVIFDALLTEVAVTDGNVEFLRFATQSGYERVIAERYIDASGSCELFFRGGFKTEEGNNALAFVAHAADGADLRKWYSVGVPEPWNNDLGRRVAGTAREDVNWIIQEGQKDLFDKLKKEGRTELATLPTMPQFRMIRRIAGGVTVTGADANQYAAESLCVCGDFERRGVWYELPYGCFVGEAKNAVAAGRIVSASDAAWNVTRVIPVAALTGEVSGVIAAQSIDCGCAVNALRVERLQNSLEERGILLHG